MHAEMAVWKPGGISLFSFFLLMVSYLVGFTLFRRAWVANFSLLFFLFACFAIEVAIELGTYWCLL